MNRFVLFLFCYCFFTYSSGQINSKELTKTVSKFVNEKELVAANVGVFAIDGVSGKVLVNYQGNKEFATASLMKLITTATVLEQKGRDYRYETRILHSKYISKGILYGDLYIKGSGDPTFNSSHISSNNILADISNLLKKNGIKSIKGAIILDVSMFEMEVPPTWIWEDIANYYGTSVSPINYRDNLYHLYFKTGQAGTKAKIIDVFPKQPLQFDNQVYASSLHQDKTYIFGSPMSPIRLVKGTLPQYQKRYAVKGAMANAAKTFGDELQKELIARGISIEGEIKVESHKTKKEIRKLLGSVYSPALEDIVRLTNQKSLNLYAEALLHLVEGAKTNERKDLLEALKDFWQKKGLNTEAMHLHDGSGLSHFNTVSPNFFVELLQFMKNNEVFRHSLAISGKTGTLLWLGKGTPLEGRVQGKSGSMQQVLGYAGYLTTKSGKEVIFAIMVNNAQGARGDIQRKIAKMLQSW